MKMSSLFLFLTIFPCVAIATTDPQIAFLDKATQLGLSYNLFAVATNAAAGKPAFDKCSPLKGTKVLIVGKHAYFGQPDFFTKVKVLDGNCSGEIGWVKSSYLSNEKQ